MLSGLIARQGMVSVALLGWLAGPATALGAPPNVLMVTIDTLRADRLGCYGYAQARTPVLDRLAREGVLFERAFSPVPLTLPAHSSLFTGTYPPFHGVRDNAGFVLADERLTLAEALHKQGYRTGAVVGAFVLDSKFGIGQGFEHFYDNFDLSQHETVSPGYIQRRADEVVDQALRWLKEDSTDSKPFFLWVHLYDPHDPYTPPEPYASRHRGRPYDGEIEFADAQLGRLIKWLEANSQLKRTLIVATGDHGESLGEHQESKHGFFVYNAALHVPLIFRFPDAEHAGKRISSNVSLVDVFPTLVQSLRLPRGEYSEVQGDGLLSLIVGRQRPPMQIYAETYYPRLQFGWSQLRALIKDRQKYILAPQPELYDLQSDFSEKRNNASDNQALANRMREELQAFAGRLQNPDRASASRNEVDPATLERLRSLGYAALSMGAPLADDGFESLADPKQQVGTYNELGRLFELSENKHYQQAIAGYRKVIAQQPGLKLARFKLAQAYYHTNRFQEALEEFKAVVQLGGPEAMATFDLAQTYFRLGRFEEAALGFEQTLQRDPEHLRARINLGVCYKNLRRIPEAIGELERALDRAPEDVFALSNLGISYSLAGRHGQAVDRLQKAVQLSPQNALLHANLATALQRMGRTEDAQKHLSIARRLNPDLFKRPRQ